MKKDKNRENHRQLVFIDDSGDPGFKKDASSSVFVIAGVVFTNPKDATRINKAITEYRRLLGWRDGHEFKFRTTAKGIKIHFLEIMSRFDFKIYAVYIRKTDYPNDYSPSNSQELYNWATKELLTIMPLNKAVVITDGKYTKQYRLRVKAYIRQSLNAKNVMKIESFDVHDSRRDNLIQLADVIAGSINRSFQVDKTDSETYISIISKKIVKLKKLDLKEL